MLQALVSPQSGFLPSLSLLVLLSRSVALSLLHSPHPPNTVGKEGSVSNLMEGNGLEAEILCRFMCEVLLSSSLSLVCFLQRDLGLIVAFLLVFFMSHQLIFKLRLSMEDHAHCIVSPNYYIFFNSLSLSSEPNTCVTHVQSLDGANSVHFSEETSPPSSTEKRFCEDDFVLPIHSFYASLTRWRDEEVRGNMT